MAPTNSEETSIYTEYFKLTKEYQKQYGENTIVLMQVGAFFEVYGLRNTDSNEIIESQINEFSQICQLNVSEKKILYSGYPVLMAGFRDYSLDKYLQKIVDNNYTSVVYVQEKNEKNTKRILHSIHSAGTYISNEIDSIPQITNNIMCIWFETFKPIIGQTNTMNKDIIIYGVAVANIFTGKSSIFEYQTPYLLNPTTFDELERTISIYSPSEMIIASDFDTNTLNTIIQYSGIKTPLIHKVNTTDVKNEKIQNCMKQKYIQHILSRFFGEESYQICSEFNTHHIATQSFCYLLNFIQEHNPNLVKKISLPIFNNTSDRLILANHTLRQLNIIDDNNNDGKRSGQLSSVLSFLNKCCSAMGKRRFQYQLLHPTFNEEWLNSEYSIIEYMLQPQHNSLIDPFRKLLLQIRDIEKISRQLVTKKLNPSSVFHLYKTVEIIDQINTCLYESPQITDYLCKDFIQDAKVNINILCNELNQFIERHLKIDLCKTLNNTQSFDTNFICPGISQTLDNYIAKNENNCIVFTSIKNTLNKLIQCHEKTDLEFIKEHETEKSGTSLQITKKRGQALKTILTKLAASENPDITIFPGLIIPAKDFKLTSASGSSDEIECPTLTNIIKEQIVLKEKINQEISIVYDKFLDSLEKEYYSVIDFLASYISKLDVLQSKVYIAREYKYCKPIISNSQENSFIDAKDMRHVLIEHIQQNEIYVPNDICLGITEIDCDGILLLGTNVVGKTSLIRSLGICIILAQSGMFVPCSKFEYKPYTAIFSRILSNDNLFKGLSTFAVEMSELRTILKMSDNRSIILGDEICSGTEIESGLSIVTNALLELHDRSSSFIFSTHYHQLLKFDEINDMKQLKCKYLSVDYDKQNDCLIYDRKLKDGSGDKNYGLIVCKSLHMPKEFIEKAYELRNKYFPESKGELSFQPSVYNAKKIRSLCEKCGESIAEETHHIQQQKDADENGSIEHFHKNHLANLMALCEKCHLKEHSVKDETIIEPTKKTVRRKKTTAGYKVL